MALVTLSNCFHGTHTTVRTGTMSSKRAQAVRTALCPYSTCKCGQTALKTRGPQPVEIVGCPDGTVQVGNTARKPLSAPQTTALAALVWDMLSV